MDLYCDYDENLSQNPFFRKLQADHKIIIDTAPLENWVICIPRSATIQPEHLTNADFLLAHVLIPNEELPQSHFTSLAGVEVRLEQKRLHVRETPTSNGGESVDEAKQMQIESLVLFEEVFYTKQLFKYKVWCIETPLIRRFGLNSSSTPGSSPNGNHPSPPPPGIYVVRDAKDAVDIIWNETHSDAIFRKIDLACSRFCKKIFSSENVNPKPVPTTSLSSLRASVEALYAQCMQTLVANRPLKEKCRADLHFFKIIRIALETYIMNGIYETVFDRIVLATREEGELFNGAVRNVADANVTYFGVNGKHMDVVSCVRTELLRIEEYGTAIEKLACLRRSVNATSRNGIHTLGMDDLIPVVAFVLIKSGLTHWTATLALLQQFVFNDLNDISEKGADSFLVATLEAAMRYVLELSEKRKSRPPPGVATTSSDVEEAIAAEDDDADDEISKNKERRSFNTDEEFIEYFFELVRRGDEAEVLRLFRKNETIAASAVANLKNNNSIEPAMMCHPLCICNNCSLILDISNPVDYVNLQNMHGINAMHVAAMFGITKMINVLLALNADLSLVDENGWNALHYAASQGHQSAVLLLLHGGIAINAKSNDLFTALHLACLNGHEGCVKAILYYAEQIHTKVDLNGINRTGDTALHLAAKWGFSAIVETLLEYGVKLDVPNRWGMTASDCAHNSHIRHLMQNMFVVVDEDSSWYTGLMVDDTTDGAASKPEPFRGSISNLYVTRRSSANDKVIAAIRNGDTKLAYYFLGWDEDTTSAASADTTASSSASEICHPLCTCPRCSEDKSHNSSCSSISSTKILDVNATNAEGITMLHAAAHSGNADLVDFLLSQGACIGKRNPRGETALHLAVLSKDIPTISQILQATTEFELNIQDVDGNSALHVAVRTATAAIVEQLLRNEPWLDAVNGKKQTPLDLARTAFLFNIANMLEIASANSAAADESHMPRGRE